MSLPAAPVQPIAAVAMQMVALNAVSFIGSVPALPPLVAISGGAAAHMFLPVSLLNASFYGGGI